MFRIYEKNSVTGFEKFHCSRDNEQEALAELERLNNIAEKEGPWKIYRLERSGV